MDNKLKQIAHIENDFIEKFGIPRQSGRVPELLSKIVFEKEYRDASALRGLEEFSHIWLIFDFSMAHREEWLPTVRPPRLGGNTHMGVFATRSPFRPNPIGLSCVKLESIEKSEQSGIYLTVSGADLLNGTPIYDIKPYLPYTDCRPNATGGYTDRIEFERLKVEFPQELLSRIPKSAQASLIGCLAEDPRPAFQNDAERVYKMKFGKNEIHFKVNGKTLAVIDVITL